MVHITAAFIQPGMDNHQALEINNAGPMPLALRAGIALCQFMFEKCIGQRPLRGPIPQPGRALAPARGQGMEAACRVRAPGTASGPTAPS